MPQWDAGQYLLFGDERTQPAIDLVSRIKVATPRRIVDLGCGPGNSTRVLRQRWPHAEIIGLDSSPEMLEAARASGVAAQWLHADIEDWAAEESFDVVFSNATLHWLPGHARLFLHLLAQVTPGGALAVQMPAHYRSPVHQAILEAAGHARWQHLMDAPRNAMTKESPSFYYNLLQPFAARLDIWETEYYHVLGGPQAIIEWFRGTGLRPFLEAMETDEQKREFEAILLEAYSQQYPREHDGRVLLPFRRLFMVAYVE